MKSYARTLSWILLAVSVGFAWAYYGEVHSSRKITPRDDSALDKSLDNAETIILVTAILATVALTSLSLSVWSGEIKNLFPLEWILVAISTVTFWLVSNPSNVDNTYLLTGAITCSVTLFLFTFYYMREIKRLG